jgi:hypothetical protein
MQHPLKRIPVWALSVRFSLGKGVFQPSSQSQEPQTERQPKAGGQHEKREEAMLLVVFVATATMAACAQTSVFIPANASGHFGNPANQIKPTGPAITVSGPATITVTYLSGTIIDKTVWLSARRLWRGTTTTTYGSRFKKVKCDAVKNADCLIGIFFSSAKWMHSGFQAIDGTKGIVAIGIMPGNLFFMGKGRSFKVSGLELSSSALTMKPYTTIAEAST